ncbi:MAG: sigma-70 family RNA polymerase sigma factor [archaeon]
MTRVAVLEEVSEKRSYREGRVLSEKGERFYVDLLHQFREKLKEFGRNVLDGGEVEGRKYVERMSREGIDYVLGKIREVENVLAEANIPLVKFLAGSSAGRKIESQLRGTGYDFADMFSDALFAMLKAMRRYPPGEENRLTTWIRKTIFGDWNHLVAKANAGMRLPPSKRVQDKLYNLENDVPDRAIDELNLGRGEYEPSPLDHLIEREACAFGGVEQRSSLETTIGYLTNRERKALELRYGFEGAEFGYDEIGERMEITKESAKALVLRAKKKLKQKFAG